MPIGLSGGPPRRRTRSQHDHRLLENYHRRHRARRLAHRRGACISLDRLHLVIQAAVGWARTVISTSSWRARPAGVCLIPTSAPTRCRSPGPASPTSDPSDQPRSATSTISGTTGFIGSMRRRSLTQSPGSIPAPYRRHRQMPARGRQRPPRIRGLSRRGR